MTISTRRTAKQILSVPLFADSLGVNSALKAEPLGNDGRGVCSSKNADKTGLRSVKKGCFVEYQDFRYLVLSVRRGVARCETLLHKRLSAHPVHSLKVVG